MKSVIRLFLIGVLFVGCGESGDTRGVDVNGLVAGKEFVAQTGAFAVDKTGFILVALIDDQDICEMAESGEHPSTMQWLSVFLCYSSEERLGDYEIQQGDQWLVCSGKIAWAEIRQISDNVPSVVPAESGIISIEEIDDEKIVGTMNINFNEGENISGSFYVQYCDSLEE